MDNPFFTALEGNGFDAATLAEQTNKVLVPFINYLNNSIKALENKEVSCEWRPVSNDSYELKTDMRIWRITPVSKVEILNDQQGWYEILSEVDDIPLDEYFAPDTADPVIAGKGADRQRFLLTSDDYQIEENHFKVYLPEMAAYTEIQWSGYQLRVRPLSVPLDNLEYVFVDGLECKVTQQNENHLLLEGRITQDSTLSINSQNMSFQLVKSLDESFLATFSAKEEGSAWLVCSKDKPSLAFCNIEDVTEQRLSQLNIAHFQHDTTALLADEWTLSIDKGLLKLNSIAGKKTKKGTSVTCSIFPTLAFAIQPFNSHEKWIQLIEKDGAGDDTGKSELDYFFVDNQNIKLLDSTQRKFDDGFRVLKSRPEERQILLARNLKGKKSRDSEYPSTEGRTCEIRVSVDTSQLKRQKDAINQLLSRPSLGHGSLIQLFQARDKIAWQDVQPVNEESIDWKVLTDPKFDGCDRQRAFVIKALATQDFAILDGPPGTGKTTTILELIIQLVLDGKRVLLSASTHAAINNVLERVKESSVLAQHIYPLRIGDESSATGVEEFQFDKVLEELRRGQGCEGISKQLMLDSSNLVCGTTIGILRLFRDKDITLDNGEPPFDVMIIDECSKTTFQEFLVPARFAKHWILVGDVRQLSPFTDREQIVSNLDGLILKPHPDPKKEEYLSPNIQQACFLLEALRGSLRRGEAPYQQPMLVPVPRAVLQALSQEIEARMSVPALSKGLRTVLIIPQNNLKTSAASWVKHSTVIQQQPWHLYDANLCFIDEMVLPDLQTLIPSDMLVLHKDWQRTSQAFVHKLGGTATGKFKVKTTEFKDTQHIQKELLDGIDSSKWSEEVCWRLEREYWLRLSKNYQRKTGYLTETLERLFPKSVQADGRIHILKNITFPSILEALSGEGLQKCKKDDPTTLNQGFKESEKQQRHVTLTYQHRMHPNISAFPRRQFYPQGVLADGSQTTAARAWKYDRYAARNIWLDVAGKTFGNANSEEVKAVVGELKAFCDWAGRNTKDNQLYDVAILTFYKGQEKALRKALQQLPGNSKHYARFNYKGISIKLATVDYFQGQEADVVFLSMVNTHRDGFMDSPNRLNVSITRARYQLVVVGHHDYFSTSSRTEELRELAKSCEVHSVRPLAQCARKIV